MFFYPTKNGFYNPDNYENISILKDNDKIALYRFDNFLNSNFFLNFF